MADITRITENSDIKKTGGFYSTGYSNTLYDREVDELTAIEAGAQNAGSNDAIGQALAGTEAYFMEEISNGNSGATKTINFLYRGNQKLTLTDDCTLTFIPPTSARKTRLHLVQGGSGNYTITLPSGTSGSAPVLLGTVGASTIVNLYYDGSIWHV